MLVDVHCHLYHEKFKKDLDKVIERAKKANVKVIISSGVNAVTNRETLELAKKYEMIKASMGLYPLDLLGEPFCKKASGKNETKPFCKKASGKNEVGLTRQIEPFDLDDELKFIFKNKEKIIAIGECGLEFMHDLKNHKKQMENFEKIIKFAEKIKKPLIVHSRKAEKECLDLLESSKLKKVMMHCFSGNKKLIKRGYDLGYYFSIPPVIVRLQHFQMLAGMIDISRLLTETDAPWLSPYPDKRNEPSFVVESIKKIAEIKKLNRTEVENVIFMNYQKLFL